MDAKLDALIERVGAAAADRTPLRIRGGGTKDFYGNAPVGEVLDTRVLRGIVAYEPSELVVSAQAGTSLAELDALLVEENQMLAFEPPHFGCDATVGGCVACGLAGPRRASYGTAAGGVRDFLLGAQLLDGRGRLLSFGGTVMKNVAGYDVARALPGSLGILGVITQVSLKVLPRPAIETTLRFELDEITALGKLNAWAGQPWPVSASAWCEGALALRLSGAHAAVEAAQTALGGEEIDGASLWRDVREHRHPFFTGDAPLWRLSLPSIAEPIDWPDAQLIEWGGALRWLRSRRSADEVRARAQALGGHATLFRGGDRAQGVFTPLTPSVAAITKRLKAEFDPAGIMNPGRMYAGI